MNFYFDASKILDRLDAKQGSIKGLIATLPEKNRKRSAALIIETLKYKPVLLEVIASSGLMKQERKLTSQSLVLVLVHDLLLARGIQSGDGPIKQAILRHKTRLHGEFQKLKIKRGAASTSELAQTADERSGLITSTAAIPRYVRVNTAMWTTPQAIEYLTSHGFTLTDSYTSGASDSKDFAKDAHIQDLLLFAPQTSFADEPAYQTGKLILQDKASCFPAAVLAPPASDYAVVIDATAAPGNKTSHLSALMKNKGKASGFPLDARRFKTLKTMLDKAQCTNAVPVHRDFLTVDPNDGQYSSVTHILLDPSCSGSGIVNRLDYLIESGTKEDEDVTADRLSKLAAFQLKMIKHAMKFPQVKKIVYSTCSIHATENEHVVRDALLSEEAQANQFSLAPRNEALGSWSRRGLESEMASKEDAESVIRCSPGEDFTNGFFVSCFIRKEGCGVETSKRKAEDDGNANPLKKKAKKKKAKKSLPS
ncbi:S-adenosyl-L-methionine-dependent methyltransferase [Ephemerocybe angulata]|uniref:S-adenosyl-L-methionine-dependent methyltransferase n=1 Tax=Ephemerocybe angulata TaxID=980116 RepID=A0A8H6M8U5_9AGAR|nr:S-adenosyl-L-methionine-dependent methyltransferase [Tulosesus angulatus]